MGNLIKPFGYLIKVMAQLFGNNYGWAIIGFTVLMNLLMIPLVIKQQKSTAQMQKLSPKLKEIQKKYEFDKERQNQEISKLYQESGANPLGGCLPMLIQFPIIIILYQAIIKPLTYMFNVPVDAVAKLQELLGLAGNNVQQIEILQQLGHRPEILQMPDFAQYNIIALNFNFFGMDLGARPQLAVFNALWIIPILSAATSYMLSKLTMAQSGQSAGGDGPGASQMNSMTKIMPLMSAVFTFSFPAGIGLYWIAGNVVRMAQQYFVTAYLEKQTKDDPLVIEPEEPGKIRSSQQKKKKGRK